MDDFGTICYTLLLSQSIFDIQASFVDLAEKEEACLCALHCIIRGVEGGNF